MSIDVELWQWIVSQVFAIITLICVALGFQFKSKSSTLLVSGLAAIFLALSVAFLENWILVGLMAISAVRSFTFAWVDSRKTPISAAMHFFLMLSFMVLTVILTVITMIYFEWWWFDFFLLTASLFIIFGQWAKGIHFLRIALVVYSVFAIINHAVFLNVTAILVESVIIVSIVIFYIRFYFGKKDDIVEIANE